MYVSILLLRGLCFSIGHRIAYNACAQGEWEAVGADSGTKFANIELGEGEWFDYDEKAGEEVSIKDIKWEITRA